MSSLFGASELTGVYECLPIGISEIWNEGLNGDESATKRDDWMTSGWETKMQNDLEIHIFY